MVSLNIVTDKIVDSLNSLDSFSNDRLLIYAGAEPLSEKHRLKLWVSGITVCDSLEELQEAMENITKMKMAKRIILMKMKMKMMK